VPFSRCDFSDTDLRVRIAGAHLGPAGLAGLATAPGHSVAWDLAYQSDTQPLFLLPFRLYRTRLPRAKSLVAKPLAVFGGELQVDGTRVGVSDWVGSQNHNWGSKHTDHYAWGQVAGFDTHPQSFLEVGTARLKIGPLWTPFMTVLVLRHAGREIALNSLRQSLRATASFTYFTWRFSSEDDAARIEGTIDASREAFVGLLYYNPPGGTKHCLNSKLASCELRLTDKQSGTTELLATRQRAAFEILTDDRSHGVEIRV